jgi:phosphatidyl-myo-inositol dimannoside synthase
MTGMPPAIWFLSRKWPPAMGGMETYAHRLAAELEACGTLRRSVLPGRPNGAPPSVLRLMAFGLATAMRLLATWSPADVVHVSDMASWPLAFAAGLRSRRTALVLSAHGTDVSYPRRGGLRGRAYGAYLRLGARFLPRAAVIANSAATAEAAARFGFDKVAVVRLGADAGPVRTPVSRTRVLFAGRVLPMKGCGWFVREVLPRLPEDMTLAVAGTLCDAKEAELLDRPRVEYLGRLDPADLRAAFAGALCVVVPNVPRHDGLFEGFGLVALEATAAGGVVLAADHGGLRDAVVDGTTGLLLPPGDAAAWADAIVRVRRWSDAHRADFLRGAEAVVRRDYGWDRVACETAGVYRAAASSVAAAGPATGPSDLVRKSS